MGRESEKSKLLKRLYDGRAGSYSDYGSASSNAKYRRYSVDLEKVQMSKLFKYSTSKDKWLMIIGTIAAIIHGSGMPALAIVFGEMTNTFIIQGLFGFHNSTQEIENLNSTETLEYFMGIKISSLSEFSANMAEYSLYYVYIGLAVLISSIIQAVCWERSCDGQVYRLRQEFFYQILRQDTTWFDRHQTGDLAMKLSDDLEKVREGIGHKFSMIIQHLTTFVGGFIIGLITSWQLTLVMISLTPLLAGASAFTGHVIVTQSAREQKKYGKAGSIAEEVLSSIKTVAAFGGERREIFRYEACLNEGLSVAIKKYHILAIGLALVFLITYGSYGLGYWFGCQLLLKNLLTPGDIFTIFFSVLMGAFSLGNAVPYISALGIARGSAAIIFDIIDSMPRIDPYSNDGRIPDRLQGRIHFKDIYFRYPSRMELPIFRNFNLEIEPGKTVAIVGCSGSGKSTVGNLLLRFYDPEGGTIVIDGNDIKQLNLAWLRSRIGVVSQEPILFDTTIYENIRYGREDVTPDQVVDASKLANAHDFIQSLPSGYETFTGERGTKLSGGQKQRICIARALVRNPTILLLDEATSALDARAEWIVKEAMDRARKGRTTIIIAHRLSTIRNVDLIYAINDGRVVETGNHAQLMAKEGYYFDLVMAQTSLDAADELTGDASASYDSLEIAPKGNYEFERRLRRRIRANGRKRLRAMALPDPDKTRLLIETKELNAVNPGLFKILKVNEGKYNLLIGGLIGSIITGCVTPIFAYFYAEMFSGFSLVGQELERNSVFWALMFLALAIITAFGFWLRTILIASSGEHLTKELRLMSYISIVRQSSAWFDKRSSSASRLSVRLARDAPLVKAAGGHRLSTFISNITTILLGLGIAFYFGWKLALVILLAFPILVVSGYIHIKIQQKGIKKEGKMLEDAGRIVIEAIQNIRTVQIFSLERIFYGKYVEYLFPIYMESHKQTWIYATIFGLSEALLFFIYAAAFYYGSYLVQNEIMTSSNVYRVFFSIAFSAISVGQATSFIADYTKANLAASLIFNLIETKSTIDPFGLEGLRPVLYGRITFNDVNFSYPSRRDFPVLKGLSFDLQPGITLALVGPSGCGKSTVVSLLERFYDVNGGQIMIDGFDLRTLNVAHLRQMIGLVTQEPVLFDTTVRENIAYGYGGDSSCVTEGMIIEAAIAANIHNFITGLPLGYETLVGERGTQLSGGQKQRIAIARALIRNPRILLLDEATSALDTESEKIVQEALDQARTGRTCIIIAHRLSTIQSADVIAVMNAGKIVEMGTHEQLIKSRKVYYNLTKKQQITY